MNRVISVIITGNAAPLQSSLLTAGTAVKAFEIGLVASGLAIAVALKKSVEAASEFDREMRNVSTISKETQRNFDGMSDAVLDLARQFPQSATTAAKALYQITSSGKDGAEALSVLRASLMAASAGLTTADVAARGVMAVLNAYGMSGLEAAKVSDILFQTVNKGVLSFEELSNQLGDFVAQAAAFGKNARGDFIVPFEDAAAAMATMTLSGLNAAEAATSLNRVLTSLLKPSEALSAALKQQGYESGVAAVEALGLKGTIDLLRESTGGNVEVLVRMFNEIRAARGALALMSNEGKNYKEVAGAISNETERLNATQKAYAEQSKGLAFQQEIARNSLHTLAIEMGQTFLPALIQVTQMAQDVLSVLNSLPDQVKQLGTALLAAGAAAAVLGGSFALLRGSMTFLATQFPGFAAALSRATPYVIGLGGVIALGTVALAAFGAEQRRAKQTTEGFTQAIQQQEQGVKGAVERAVALELAERGLVTQAQKLGISLSDVAKAAQGDAEAMERVKNSHSFANREFELFFDRLLKVASGFKAGSKEAAEQQAAMDALNPSAAALRKQMSALGAEVVANAEKWDELALSVNMNSFALARMADGSLETAKAIVDSITATQRSFASQTDLISGFATAAEQHEQALQRVSDAQERVSEVSDRAAERQAANAERITDAERNYAETVEQISQAIADAKERAAERQITAAQAVRDAEERAVDASKSAAERLQNAERRLRDLRERQAAASDPKRAAEVARQQELRKAQEDVTEARKELAETEQQNARNIAKARAEQAKADEEARKAGEMTRSQQRQLEQAQENITKAQQQAAKDNAAAQKEVAAALRDLASAQAEVASTSLEGFFQSQVEEAQKFVDDLRTAAERGLDKDIIRELLEAGPKTAAPILQGILSGNNNTLIQLYNDARKTLTGIGDDAVETLRVQQVAITTRSTQTAAEYGTAMKILQAKAKLGGEATADELAKQLDMRVEDVRRIAEKYTIVLADSLNPVLRGIGASPIEIRREANYQAQKKGQTTSGLQFAEGGALPDAAKFQPPGTLVQWAEPETGGEWFLPDAPSKRARSLDIASDMLGRWGYEIRKSEFASGGFLSPSDIPRPPDYSEMGDMVGRTGAEVSRYLYDKVTEWVRSTWGGGGGMSGNGYGFQALVDYLRSQEVPFEVTSTLRPGSITAYGNLSFHSTGQAADFVSANMRQIFDTFMQVRRSLVELFYDPAGVSVKNGEVVGWTVGGHDDHVHAATWAGPHQGPGLPTGYGGAMAGGDAVSIGRQMAAERGWTGSEWDALYELWRRESTWDPNAVNPSSGAYGIPQALPAAHGRPYDLGDPSSQIAWGLNYIAGRYGSPSAALAFHDRNNWYAQGGFHGARSYDRGGVLMPGVTMAYNGTGRPEAVGIDYERLGNEVARALRDLPAPVIKVGRDEFGRIADKALDAHRRRYR